MFSLFFAVFVTGKTLTRESRPNLSGFGHWPLPFRFQFQILGLVHNFCPPRAGRRPSHSEERRPEGDCLFPDDQMFRTIGEAGDVTVAVLGDDENVMFAIATSARATFWNHDHGLHRDDHARL